MMLSRLKTISVSVFITDYSLRIYLNMNKVLNLVLANSTDIVSLLNVIVVLFNGNLVAIDSSNIRDLPVRAFIGLGNGSHGWAFIDLDRRLASGVIPCIGVNQTSAFVGAAEVDVTVMV